MLYEKKLEVGLKVERVWEQRDAFLALNPAASVPVLIEEDESIVVGHYAIVEYLEAAYTDVFLSPRSLPEKNEMRRLVSWFDEKFHKEVSGVVLHEKIEKHQEKQGFPDAKLIRQALARLPEHMDYIAWLVENRNWLAGEELTIADLAAAAHLSCLDYFGDVPWNRFPATKEWYMRLKSRPAFRPILEDRVPAFPSTDLYKELDF